MKGSKGRAARRRTRNLSVAERLKGALLCAAAASVLLPSFLSPGTGQDLGRVALCREGIAFFALTALAMLLFPRAKLRDVGAGATSMVVAVELARLTPALHLTTEPLDMLARIAGVVAALAPVVVARAFPAQRRGCSPTSLAYLP